MSTTAQNYNSLALSYGREGVTKRMLARHSQLAINLEIRSLRFGRDDASRQLPRSFRDWEKLKRRTSRRQPQVKPWAKYKRPDGGRWRETIIEIAAAFGLAMTKRVAGTATAKQKLAE